VASTAVPGPRLGSAPVDVVWTALQWQGFEHVMASYDPAGFRADSWMILVSEAGPARVTYHLSCDSQWQVTALAIRVFDAASDRTLMLRHDAAGHWQAEGMSNSRCAGVTALPDLRGCTDLDISRSPLTNTLPIRRLGISTPCDIDVVYVSVPELTVSPVRQRYTRLQSDRPLYRYESGSFSTDLPVDADGIVIDYPGVWRRIVPGHGNAADRETRL